MVWWKHFQYFAGGGDVSGDFLRKVLSKRITLTGTTLRARSLEVHSSLLHDFYKTTNFSPHSLPCVIRFLIFTNSSNAINHPLIVNGKIPKNSKAWSPFITICSFKTVFNLFYHICQICFYCHYFCQSTSPLDSAADPYLTVFSTITSIYFLLFSF